MMNSQATTALKNVGRIAMLAPSSDATATGKRSRAGNRGDVLSAAGMRVPAPAPGQLICDSLRSCAYPPTGVLTFGHVRTGTTHIA